MNREREAKRLIGLALDFWSAPGIDMPSIDLFDGMVKFMGDDWKCPWEDNGHYTGEEMKPVGMSWEQFKKRERHEEQKRT